MERKQAENRTGMIVAVSTRKPQVTMEQMQPLMREEARVAWDLYKTGVIRENYSRADGLGTVTIFECVDVAEAQHLADAFPFVKAGLIEFEYFPVGAFTPWEALFAHEHASTTDQISE